VASGDGAVPRVFETVDALEACVGGELGVSGWIEIDQSRIDLFADATDDHQWIHVDRDRAAAESPYGATIAHGFLTLSMVPRMLSEAFTLAPRKTGINYGLDKVRFVAPVPAGARIRGRVGLERLERQKPDTIRAHYAVTVEIEGAEKPACVAQTIAVYIVE
jgi:acyl dehydratase